MADNEAELEEEVIEARPRKRGVVQKLTAKPKRNRANTQADNDFVMPDGDDDQAPLPKRIKTVATTEPAATEQIPTDEPTTGKRMETAKAKAKPKPRTATPTSALDRAQRAEEARFRKQKNVNKLAEAMKKQPEFKRPVITNSAQDKKVKKELRESMSTPVFPNVYTNLDNIIAVPYAFPQVESDMEAGEFGVLRIRWFPTASDPTHKALAEAVLARYKEATRRPRTQRW
ncbi:hypothetical protein E8E11_000051 [Didymella keratinophila]|nr:hypothetical protein E8E11_000051 [Didymella keratinophila]